VRPEVGFSRIREHRGTRHGGFEELCCQLAALDDLAEGSSFMRKGPGADQGLECYRTYADGSEVGWQAKYFLDGFGSVQVQQVKDSLAHALAAHPKLKKFILCLPVNLSDNRAGRTLSEVQKFERWKAKSISQAAAAGRELEIELWSASIIEGLLGRDTPAYSGRARFWFDTLKFTPTWFKAFFEIQKENLDERYTPESHVDLPVTHALHSLARSPGVFSTAERAAAAIKQQADDVVGTLRRRSCAAISDRLLGGLAPLLAALEKPRASLEGTVPVSEWLKLTGEAKALIETAVHEFRAQHPGDDSTARALHELFAEVQQTESLLGNRVWKFVNERVLVIWGEAGIGKSHLLADFGEQQLRNSRPFVMVLSGTLRDSEPWPQIRAQLDLGQVSDADSLGAFDAAGEAADCRAVLAIDALNENQGIPLWRQRLRGFVAYALRFPHVAVVLTIRDTYLSYLPFLQELPQVQHRGFAGKGASAAKAYLDRRGITRPSSPNLAREFENPLFLRTCCAFLDSAGLKELPKGLDGITEIFEFYLNSVAKRVQEALGLSQQKKVARKALDAFIATCVERASGNLPTEEADALFDRFFDSRGLQSCSLLAAYLSEGVLTQEVEFTETEPVDVVRFTFERLSDHLRARRLLDSVDLNNPRDSFSADPLKKYFAFDAPWEYAGVVEALAVQIPERFELEMFDVLPAKAVADESLQDAFEASLRWRSPQAFTEQTLRWATSVARMGGRSVYSALLLVCTEPRNAFNAEYLHGLLSAMPMPQRDSQWSIFLAEDDLEDGEAVSALVDWAWDAETAAVDPQRLHLATVALTWFFTASNRAVRDRATKALVNLLAGQLSQGATLLEKFAAVDDLYVVERLMSACYGAAMQGVDVSGLRVLADAAWRNFFGSGKQPPIHLLARDYALGILQYADSAGRLPTGADPAAARKKFSSPFPLGRVSDEDLKEFQAPGYGDSIVSSLQGYGDFGNYTVKSWLHSITSVPVSLAGKSTKQVFEAWVETFLDAASIEQLEAYGALQRSLYEYLVGARGHGRARQDPDPLWIALTAANDRFKSALSADQAAEYEQMPERHLLESARMGRDDIKPEDVDHEAVRRWICLRAHRLGWTRELFEQFDESSLVTRDRMGSHRIERIGKKYQRIALAEVTARLVDNLAVCSYFDDGDLRAFGYSPSDMGTRRDHDPSLLLKDAPQVRWESTPVTWWTPSKPKLPAGPPKVLLSWLPLEHDLCNSPAEIAVTSPDGDQWLVLDCHRHWTLEGERKRVHADAWSHVTCFLTKADGVDAFAKELLERHRGDSSRLRDDGGLECFLGEHGWREPSKLTLRASRYEGIATPFASVSQTLTAEGNTKDNSIDATFSIEVPSAGLMRLLGLRLRNGRSPEYLDAGGSVRWLDPSLRSAGPTAAVVSREFFEKGLRQSGLASVWVIAGEKNVYPAQSIGGDRGWGGCLYHTTILSLVEGQMVALGSSIEHRRPDPGQLEALLARN
jgi:hypothetical protein